MGDKVKKKIVDGLEDTIVIKKTESTINYPPITDGVSATVRRFGGIDIAIGDGIDSLILLEWGSGTTFKRVYTVTKIWEYTQRKTVVGNGTDHFRLRRINNSNADKSMIAWLDILVDEPETP